MNLISHLHSQGQDFINRKLSVKGLGELTSSHGNILYCLSTKEHMTLGELTQAINRDKSTTTVLVRKLQTAGLVELKKDKTDSRKKIITLTESGKTYTQDMSAISRHLLETAWKNFDDQEQETLLSLLTKLSKNLNN